MNYDEIIVPFLILGALCLCILMIIAIYRSIHRQYDEQKGCPVNLEEVLEHGDKIEVKEIYKEYAIIVRMNFEYIPYDNGLLFINTEQTLIVGEIYCYNEEKNSIKHIPQEQIPAYLNCLN